MKKMVHSIPTSIKTSKTIINRYGEPEQQLIAQAIERRNKNADNNGKYADL